MRKPQFGHSNAPASGSASVAQTGQYLQPSSSLTDRNNRPVHEDPAPTPEEQEEAPDHQDEMEGAAAPGQEDDQLPGDDPPAEPIHES